MIQHLRLRLRALFNRATVEREMEEELRFHMEQQTKLFMAGGLSRTDAERQARLAFGSLDGSREGHRDHRGTRPLEDFSADLRYAIRSLWRDRALSTAGVLTLALGIGATTAVFSAVNEVMLRALPFRDSGRLVQLWEQNSDRGWYKNVVAPANYLDWRSRVQAFEGAAAYFDYLGSTTLLGRGEPMLLSITSATGNFMQVLGVKMALGRGFTPDADDWDDGQRPLVISHRLWRTVFKSDSGIVGQSILLSGRPWQVVGVLPDAYILPTPNVDIITAMLWPKPNQQAVFFRRAHNLRVVARLKPGVSVDAATTQLMTVAKQLETEYPATNTRMYAGMTPLRDWIVGDTKRPLIVLLASAAVLLLIACANVGNLLLVHALGRSRDVALRFVLGASRQRVARQALTESLVLSASGGIAGTALGWIGAKVLLAMQPTGMLPVTDIRLDYRVLAFTTLLVGASSVLFGVGPALIATRQSPASALSGGGRSITNRNVRRWGRQLVVAEVALAVMLMVGAGLLLRSYERLSKVDAGFDPNGVITATLSIPGTRYDSAYKVKRFYNALLENMRAIPGVQSVAAARELPVTQTSWTANLAVQGRPVMEQSTDIIYRETAGEYFRTMRVPLLKGRPFAATDDSGSAPVAIINEAMAKQYFANENPVGLVIANDRVPDSNTVWRTIVGVVGGERQGSLALPARPEVYLPYAQNPTRRMTVVARVADGQDPAAFAPSVRRAVRDLDSLIALTSLRTMNTVHGEAMSRQRFTSALILTFAITGVALALVGVFGVLAQLVQARWREMGIRMALGAQQSDVRWMVLRSGGALLGVGVGIGLAVSLWATRVLTSLLFQVAPTDAITYAGVTLLVVLIGLIAASVPAWRASTANPASTLRSE